MQVILYIYRGKILEKKKNTGKILEEEEKEEDLGILEKNVHENMARKGENTVTTTDLTNINQLNSKIGLHFSLSPISIKSILW